MKQERMEEDEETPELKRTKPCGYPDNDSFSKRIEMFRECSKCHESLCPVRNELDSLHLKAM